MVDFSPSSNGSPSGRSTRIAGGIARPDDASIALSIKRALDLALIAAGAVVAVPLVVFVAAAVWVIDGRPVFYSHERIGLGGRPFTLYKFRTMPPGSERANRPVWAVRNDARCTRLGAWLRRSSLDELPQLWNVVRGEMSLVGPRPERAAFVEEFARQFPAYRRRLTVPPGITGYAQIHGWRGDTSVAERLRHDLHYVDSRSVLMDLRVLVATVPHVWTERTRDGVGR